MSPSDSLSQRFLTTAEERLTELGDWVATMLASSDVNDVVGRIARGLHTVKGEARLLGFDTIEKICHASEEVLFSHQKHQRIDNDTELALFEGIDAMFALVQNARDNTPHDEEEFSGLLKRLTEAVITGAPTPQTPQPTREAEIAVVEEDVAGRATGAALRRVHLSIEQIDHLTNLTGSISGALVRNHQYIDALAQSCTALQEALSEIADKRLGADAINDLRAGAVSELIDTVRNMREHHFGLDFNYSELAETVRNARIQPLSAVFSRYPTFVRGVGREVGKEMRVQIDGGDLGVDQRVLEDIAEPCLHLLRNAIVHGIEAPAERVVQGKSPHGTIHIMARQDGELVRIVFRDDGRGIDTERVVRRAVALGLITKDEAERLSADDAMNLIFRPGLSTAGEADELAGRGVGLDVVAAVIADMGGTFTVSSEPGKGAAFTLIVPISLSLSRALLVEISGQLFALPNSAVVEVHSVPVKEIRHVEGREMLMYRKRLMPLVRLREALGLRGIKDIFANKVGVVILRAGDELGAFVVDRFVGEREIVARPFDSYIGRPFMAGGITTIEDGRLVVLLHVPDVLSSVGNRHTGLRGGAAQSVRTIEGSDALRILFAEDSVITREYAASILRSQGYAITEVNDGQAALELLQKNPYDLLLTDLQMPRLDGFKLAAAIRKNPALRHLPVIVMSTLDTPETKKMAMDAGADAYIVKSNFSVDTLVGAIRNVIR